MFTAHDVVYPEITTNNIDKFTGIVPRQKKNTHIYNKTMQKSTESRIPKSSNKSCNVYVETGTLHISFHDVSDNISDIYLSLTLFCFGQHALTKFVLQAVKM